MGEYMLISVDSNSLPYVIYDDGVSRQEVTAGTLLLTPSGDAEIVTKSLIGMFGMKSEQVDSVRGTYTYTARIITIMPAGGPIIELERAGNDLKLHGEHVFAWTRKPC